MANITPEMIEKEKNAKFAELSDDKLGKVVGGVETLRGGGSPSPKPSNNATNELTDDVLNNVSGGTVVRYSFNLQLDDSTPKNFTRGDALIAREMYCEHCKKNTIFHIPANGAAYCSVCKQLLVEVVEAPYITE